MAAPDAPDWRSLPRQRLGDGRDILANVPGHTRRLSALLSRRRLHRRSCPDAFLTRLNAAASVILYSTYLGGVEPDYGTDLALDPRATSMSPGKPCRPLPVTPAAFDRVFNGRPDIFWGDGFITKLALNGTPPGPPPLPTVAAVTTHLEVVGGNPCR